MLCDQTLDEALAIQHRMYAALTEVAELTDELSQAVDRRDSVSVRMFLSMRQEEIDRLVGHKAALRRQCAQLPPGDRALLLQLLKGERDGTLNSPSAQALERQSKNTRSLLERVCRADQAVSRRFGGPNSFYAK